MAAIPYMNKATAGSAQLVSLSISAMRYRQMIKTQSLLHESKAAYLLTEPEMRGSLRCLRLLFEHHWANQASHCLNPEPLREEKVTSADKVMLGLEPRARGIESFCSDNHAHSKSPKSQSSTWQMPIWRCQDEILYAASRELLSRSI